MGRKGVVKKPVAEVAGKLVSALYPTHPPGNDCNGGACSLSSRLTQGWTFLVPFAMPGILLQCCHGEVIVFLAIDYLDEHQTAQAGPMSNKPGAVTVPTLPCLLSPFTLTPLPTTFMRGCINSCAQRHYRWPFAGGRGVSKALSYFWPLKAWPTMGSCAHSLKPQLKREQLSEEKSRSTYFYRVSHCHH